MYEFVEIYKPNNEELAGRIEQFKQSYSLRGEGFATAHAVNTPLGRVIQIKPVNGSKIKDVTPKPKNNSGLINIVRGNINIHLDELIFMIEATA